MKNLRYLRAAGYEQNLHIHFFITYILLQKFYVNIKECMINVVIFA